MQLFLLPHWVLCDTHIVSQAKETAQILYSALVDAELPADAFTAIVDRQVMRLEPYKRVWSHPCVSFASSSIHALMFTLISLKEICAEYTNRYGRVHLCSHHATNLCNHINKHKETLIAKLGDSKDPDVWMAKLGLKQREQIASRVSKVGAPSAVGYGVCAIDEEFRVHSQGQIDLHGSYLRFYAHKAKFKFPMRWHKSTNVPQYLQQAFSAHFPDTPLLTKRLSKRSREDRSSGESVETE